MSGVLKAQPSLVFTPIISENGLLENRVRNLNQLPDGRMVVVTEGMINLYNGSNFQNIHINEEKIIPLSDYSGFHHSYIDSDGRLWVKNFGKLMLVDMKKEQFNEAPEKVLKGIGADSELADFFIDSNKNIWFISANDKLWVYDRKSRKTRAFRTNVSLCEGRPDQVYDLASIGKIVYLFYRSGNVVQFDYNSGKQLAIANSIPPRDRDIYSRTLYVVQVQNGLYQIRNGTRGILQSYNLRTGKWLTILEKSYWLNSLVADREGNLWISCREGLWFINKSLTEKRFFPSLQMVDGKSIQTEVSTLFMDRLGSLWVGTLNRGLLYYHPDRFKFKNIGRTWFGSSIDGPLRVTAMSDDGGRGILIGTNKGLFSYNNNTARLEKYEGLKSPISCNSIHKDRSGRTWLGESRGLYLLSGKDARFYPVGAVQNIYETDNGEIFLCTQNQGFGKFDVRSGTYEPVKLKNGAFLGSVSQIVEWNGRFIGISHSKIFEYDSRNKAINFPHDKGENKPAMYRHNNHQYNALLADSRGCLWFATQDGLNVWDPQLQKLYTLHGTDGLVGNNIKALAENNKGDVWISTSNGISSIRVLRTRQSFLKFAILNYNTDNGVIEGEFIERAAYMTPNSYFVAGGIDGFNIIHTDRVSKTDVSFKPLLSYFKLFGENVSISTAYDGNVILRSSIATSQTIKLKHNQNFFTIGFIALNYINPTQTYYRYKLEGVDKSWREVSSIPGMVEAIYTNLAPGKYVFKVAAAGNAKFEARNQSQIIIQIDAPFWNTTIARVIYILAIVFLFSYSLKQYIRRKHLKILRSQNEKLEEIKANFFTNISHELRTPLTLILSPLESILSRLEDGSVKHQLMGVQRNASRLLDLVNQLLDFRKLEVAGEKLNLDYCNICEYLEAFCRQFEELAYSKKVIFTWDCEPVSQTMFIDKVKLDTILNNLLSNAFKFTPAGGTVSLSTNNSPMPDSGAEALMICIQDTGIGIPKDDLSHVFNRFFQATNQTNEHTGSGIGLYMVKEYVSMHRGLIEVESEQNQGSSFTFYIPYNLRDQDEIVEDASGILKPQEGKAKILIIEDNEEFRSFLAGELKEEYDVFTANNGSEGLNSVYELHPDIIICDVMMPLMDGFELCRKLKADIQISHTPVILLTARSSDNAQIQGYEAGADAYISKPFNLNVLQLRIRKLIEQQKSRKTLFKNAIFIQPDALTTTNVDEKLVHKALECVNVNITNSNYSVEQLSRDLNMDRTGLYRKMTSLTGQTPSSFIRSVRLKRAAQLILQNEHTIGEVADLVGFNNAAYFSKAFQEEFGVKPSQYRNDTQINIRVN